MFRPSLLFNRYGWRAAAGVLAVREAHWRLCRLIFPSLSLTHASRSPGLSSKKALHRPFPYSYLLDVYENLREGPNSSASLARAGVGRAFLLPRWMPCTMIRWLWMGSRNSPRSRSQRYEEYASRYNFRMDISPNISIVSFRGYLGR